MAADEAQQRERALVTSRGAYSGDIICRDGTIERVGTLDAEPVDEQIDARGLLVLAGFIDPHVHSRDPG